MVVEAQGQRRTRKTTPRSEWSSALKKDLTRPTLLEMDGFGVTGSLHESLCLDLISLPWGDLKALWHISVRQQLDLILS